MNLIVGYEEENKFRFFIKDIDKQPDISVDTRLFGRPFYNLHNLSTIKNKLKNFTSLIPINDLTLTFQLFKDEFAVYLMYGEDGEWYAYDPDWKHWSLLSKFYYMDQLKKEGWKPVKSEIGH